MATLKTIRTYFYNSSGRADLVNPTTYANLGADRFIQAGQDMLDRMQDHRKQIQRWPITFAAGQYTTQIPRMRFVHSVWYVNSDGKKTELAYIDYQDFREKFPKLNLSYTGDPPFSTTDTSDTGTPTYWTYAQTGLVEEWNDLTTISNRSISSDTDGVELGDSHYLATGIMIGKPPTAATDITVFGNAYAKKLEADGDTSFWSVAHPDLLVQAALYQLEVFYSNTEGMKDKMFAIEHELRYIDHEQADFEATRIERMEG